MLWTVGPPPYLQLRVNPRADGPETTAAGPNGFDERCKEELRSWAVTIHGDQATADTDTHSVLHDPQPSANVLGPLTIGLLAFLGFIGFGLATLGPAAMTSLQVLALAAFCLLLAGLCRWIGRSSSRASAQDGRFRSLFEHAAVGMSIVDSDKRFMQVNHAYTALLGYEATELVGKPFTMVTHPDDSSDNLVLWDELWSRSESSGAHDTRYVRQDGSIIWVRVTANLFTPWDGTAPQVMAVVENITERKQAVQALLDAHVAVESAMEGISKLDDTGRYVFVNTPYAALLGYHPEELIGLSWEITVHPDDRSSVRAVFEQMLRVGRAEAEIRGLCKDGRTIYKHAVIVRLNPPTGTMAGHFCFVRDITERKQEEVFQATEKQALEMVANGNRLHEVLAFICRAIEAHCTPMRCAIMLVTEDQKHLLSAAAPSLPDEYNRAVDGIPIGPTNGSCGRAAYYGTQTIAEDVGTHPGWENYAPIAMKHGLRACWSQPILSSNGAVLGTFAAYYSEPRTPQPSDLKVVERVRHLAALAIQQAKVSDALRASEARFQAFMDHGPAVTFIKDEAGHHIYINPKFEDLFGVSRDMVKDKTAFDFMPADIAARLQENDQLVFSSGQALEIEETVPTPDGSAQHWLVIKFPLDLAEGQRLLGGVAIDITERKRVEQALMISEERYVRATAVGRVGVWELDVRAGTYYGDRNLKTMFGYRADELSADPYTWLNLVHPDDQSIAMAHWQRIVRCEADDYYYELRMIRKDGTVIWTDVRGHAVRDHDGQVTHLIGATVDITDRKQAEDALRESEERFRVIADTAPVLIWMAGLDKRCSYFNARWLEYTGRIMDQELGEGWVEGVHPDDVDRCWKTYSEAFDRREPFDMEYRLRKEDGQYGWIHDSGVPRLLPDGTFAGYLGACTDITARKQAEAAREMLQYAVDQGMEGVALLDSEGRYTYINEAHARIYGFKASELVGRSWKALYDADQIVRIESEAFPTLQSKGNWHGELIGRMNRGAPVHVEVGLQRLPQSSVLPEAFMCTCRDITIRKQTEALLRQAHGELEQRVDERTAQLARANCSLQEEIAERKRVEARLRTTQYAVDHAADQIFVIGPNGYFLNVNESGCRRLGYTKDELLTMSVMDIDPDFPSEVWGEFWAEFTRVGQLRLETRHRSKSGEIYPVEVVANYLCHDGRELDYAIVRDITERKQAEAAKCDSELRYKLLTEATFDGIAIHDQGILLEVNAGLERMFAYEPDELIGRSLFDLVADESREQVAANMREGRSGPYEFVGRRKDGTTIFGEVVARPYRYRGKDVRLVAGRDITERKRLESQMARHAEELEQQVAERTAEVAKLESQRAQAEKLAALGQLAAGVAHEINNPIAGIQMAFTLVKQAVDPAHPHFEFVAMIDREIARVETIVQNMYQLYRKEPRKAEAVDLQALICSLEGLFAKRMSQQGVSLVADVPPSMPRLHVPLGDLLQVLMNLLQNAIDCSKQGGRITLKVRQEDGLVKIMVSDEGTGIAPDVLPHIFDPFFTTKTERDQKRMGLGLSVSQSLVMAMGGKIEVLTELHHGSTFCVLFPQPTSVACSTAQTSSLKEVLSHDS